MSARIDTSPGNLFTLRKAKWPICSVEICEKRRYNFADRRLCPTQECGTPGVVIAQSEELSHDTRIPHYVLFPDGMGWIILRSEEEHKNTGTTCCTISLEIVI